jgi:hypothetical protein
MAPRLGEQYDIEIEIVSKPFAEFRTDEWAETDLPCAPAIMVGEEVVAEGSDIKEEMIVTEIRKQLGMPPLEPEKKGILDRFFS